MISLLGQPADWMADAACADLRTNMFPSVRDPAGQATAKAVCRACPVAAECRELGLVQDKQGRAEERWGVWGGQNGPQRGRTAARRGKHPRGQRASVPPTPVREDA